MVPSRHFLAYMQTLEVTPLQPYFVDFMISFCYICPGPLLINLDHHSLKGLLATLSLPAIISSLNPLYQEDCVRSCIPCPPGYTLTVNFSPLKNLALFPSITTTLIILIIISEYTMQTKASVLLWFYPPEGEMSSSVAAERLPVPRKQSLQP